MSRRKTDFETKRLEFCNQSRDNTDCRLVFLTLCNNSVIRKFSFMRISSYKQMKVLFFIALNCSIKSDLNNFLTNIYNLFIK